jgi:ATP-dependent helicase STH1/SNF2
LKALKADEEEAYMKLIDTAKDTRITHLLWQTDAYLDSLAQAAVAQQNESGPLDTNFDQEARLTMSPATTTSSTTTDSELDDNDSDGIT